MTIWLTASDFYTLHNSSRCELRLYLHHHGVQGTPPGPFEQLLFRLGDRHEKSHLETLGEYIDLRGSSLPGREARTRDAIAGSAQVLYQPVLRRNIQIDQIDCDVVGEPDFLIRGDGNTHLVCDAKLARRVTEKHHPEIIQQLNLYGWLYEESIGRPPTGLQVHSGSAGSLGARV